MHAEMQSPFSWDDVRVLLALFRVRTLSGAAAELGVNASTVSRRLAALEESLGARLFDRTPDGLLPTAAAEQLLPHAERLEQAASGLRSAAFGFETKPEGVVRLTAPPGVAEHFLAPALPKLLARYPGLRLEIDASIGYADLTRREADIALRVMRPESGDLVAVKIADEEDQIFASRAYAAELGALRSLGDARWIGWGHDLAHIPSARWVNERVPETAIVLRSNSIGAQLAAAEAGIGALLLPAAYGTRGTLSEVRLAPRLRTSLPPTPREPLWLVGHRALREVPRIAAIWDAVLETIGSRLEERRRSPD
jgi:DNA-binding transcriptional LysR family regulator